MEYLRVILISAVIWTALILIVTGARHAFVFAFRRLEARRAAARERPVYSLALLVRFDQTSGRFHPSAQLRGEGQLKRARMRLELVDNDCAIRLVRRRRLPGSAIGAEFPLPAFEAPEGATLDEVFGWHWDVVLQDRRGERARWRERPRPVPDLNSEAEFVDTPRGDSVMDREPSARDLVDRELHRALPGGWSLFREDAIHWTLAGGWTHEAPRAPLEWGPFSYSVYLAEASGLVIVTHGNSDAGPLSLEQALLTATVIPVEAHRLYPLSDCLARVLRESEPNQQGLT